MTTRIDHTNCSHSATPKARQACRDYRREGVREAQAMFRALTPGDTPAWDLYNATVQLLMSRLHCTFDEAYEIVEDGPTIH